MIEDSAKRFCSVFPYRNKYNFPGLNVVSKIPLKAAGAVIPLPFIFLGGFIIGVILNLFFPIPIWPSFWIQLLGLIPMVVGIWLFASAGVTFRRHKTPLMPWSPSVELVQDGPYRFTSNPIYLSFALIYLGLAFTFNSVYIIIVLAIAVILFDRTQIQNEERYLQEKFGEEYNYLTEWSDWDSRILLNHRV